jgi:serine/threonine-protein kinase
VLHIFSQVAEGVAHMNRAGWVHADLKPNNILVDEDRTVKLIDLGQSCPVGTTKQRIQGTPDYIAPEQVKRQPLDARTDVFNFGATLYWVLAGKPISTALPKNGQVTLRSDTAIAPPDHLNPDVPPALSKLVMDCIEVLPNRRPSSMDEVISRLELVTQAAMRKAAKPN